MKTLFLSEYLCSGALAGSELPASLFREGYAMWLAILQDVAREPGWEIVTTGDSRLTLPEIPRVTVHSVNSPDEEHRLLEMFAQQADACLVIAPELDHVLQQRVEQLEHFQNNRLMSSSAAVSVASDKWECDQLFRKLKIPTPATRLWSPACTAPCDWAYPWIVKPRYGAGSTDTERIGNLAEWKQWESAAMREPCQDFLVQPCLTGTPASLSVIIEPETAEIVWLPIGCQRFQEREYQGGSLPAFEEYAVQIRDYLSRIMENLTGLKGYIGFDFLIAPEQPESVLLLEINPRLTTSYLGYRQLTSSSLAAWMLGSEGRQPLQFHSGPVHFTATGEIHWQKIGDISC